MSKKILIAEDNADSRQLLSDLLDRFRSYGVLIFLAKDGQEALDLALREQPDLILLDIMMPRLNGYEVCERIKADPVLKTKTYVIMVSAKIQQEDRKQAALVGVDEYVTKPFDVGLVIERVQSALGIKPV